MKIAFVVPYVPNLIRTRPYNLITNLSSLGHYVVVFTIGSGAQDLKDVNVLRSKGIQVYYHELPAWRSMLNSLMALPSGQPLQTVYSWYSKMAWQLADLLSTKDLSQKFDVVHIEHLRGSHYGTFLKSKVPGLPYIWDSVDSISHLFRQASSHSHSVFGKLITRLELPRTERAEGNFTCLFDHVLITSETDKLALLKLVPHGSQPAPISVLPNGVDLDYFHPNPATEREPATIVFSGKMSYHANVSMVKYLVTEVMPKIWQSCPTTRLVVVGKDPPSAIKALALNPLIEITGTVEDIRPFLWKSTLAVVPLLYGAGIQNKILEAMATGTPIVTTPNALSSLKARPGIDLLVGESVSDFAIKVLNLVSNKALQRSIGDMGLRYVQENHNWKTIVSQLTNIYSQAVNSKNYQ